MTLDEALQVERLKAELAMQIEQRRLEAAAELELRRIVGLEDQARITSAASYATGVMRSLFLINGGAIVGILTLLASLKRGGAEASPFLEVFEIKRNCSPRQG